MSEEPLYDCPACERGRYTQQALRLHACPALGRRCLSREQWEAGIEIEEIKQRMLSKANEHKLEELRARLAELAEKLFPEKLKAERLKPEPGARR